MKNYFAFGILACLPLLVFEGWHRFNIDAKVTLELIASDGYRWVSMLSLLRIFLLANTFQSLVMLCDMLSETYFHHRITIENAKNISINIFTAILMLHASACLWLTIKIAENYDLLK